jgi:hypothetical protein
MDNTATTASRHSANELVNRNSAPPWDLNWKRARFMQGPRRQIAERSEPDTPLR